MRNTMLAFFLGAAQAHFPYDVPPEKVSAVHRVRAEGRIHEMGWLEKLAYAWKYLVDQKLTAPAEITRYFSGQRRLHSLLAGESPPPGAVRIGLVGDIMWLRDGWGDFLDEETLARLRSYVGLVGNLETVVSDKIPVNDFLPDWFTYNSDPRLVTSFRRADGQSLFAALSTANNHTLDHGDEGALSTLAFLDRQGIAHSGVRPADADKLWTEFRRGGIRFGFYAATFGLNDSAAESTTRLKINFLPGIAPERERPDLSEIQGVLAEMSAAKIDVKIVSLHWGFEFEFYPTARVMQAARAIVAAGADVLLGNHPHVPQPSEICFVNGYEKQLGEAPALRKEEGCVLSGAGRPRKAFIAYAIGNFTTAMYTFPCRVAPVRGLSFYRTARGVDWTKPEIELFFNTPSDARGMRRLIPIERYAREACPGFADDPERCEARRGIRFLESHLGSF